MFVTGLFIFFVTHAVAVKRSFRQRLIDKLGEGAYKGIFSFFALCGMGLIVHGWSQFDNFIVYEPPVFFKHLNILLMLPATIFLTVAYVPNNLKHRIKNPMLTGIKIWAMGHLWANGDMRSILFFGSFLIFAIIDVIAVKRRDETPDLKEAPKSFSLLAIMIGILLYLMLFMLHEKFFGVSPIAIVRS